METLVKGVGKLGTGKNKSEPEQVMTVGTLVTGSRLGMAMLNTKYREYDM